MIFNSLLQIEILYSMQSNRYIVMWRSKALFPAIVMVHFIIQLLHLWSFNFRKKSNYILLLGHCHVFRFLFETFTACMFLFMHLISFQFSDSPIFFFAAPVLYELCKSVSLVYPIFIPFQDTAPQPHYNILMLRLNWVWFHGKHHPFYYSKIYTVYGNPCRDLHGYMPTADRAHGKGSLTGLQLFSWKITRCGRAANVIQILP
jgi:hypothetical protein